MNPRIAAGRLVLEATGASPAQCHMIRNPGVENERPARKESAVFMSIYPTLGLRRLLMGTSALLLAVAFGVITSMAAYCSPEPSSESTLQSDQINRVLMNDFDRTGLPPVFLPALSS